MELGWEGEIQACKVKSNTSKRREREGEKGNNLSKLRFCGERERDRETNDRLVLYI